MVNVLLAPVQPATDLGVTVIVAVIAALVVFLVANVGILPVPLAARPMVALLLVHVLVAALTLVPANVTAAVLLPAQTVWLAGCVSTG